MKLREVWILKRKLRTVIRSKISKNEIKKSIHFFYHDPSPYTLLDVIFPEEGSFSKQSICVNSTMDHIWVGQPCHPVFFVVWIILGRCHHYLLFSCNFLERIDLHHFLFSTKATLWGGSIMITVPPRVCLEEHGKTLLSQKGHSHDRCHAMVNSLRFNQSHFLSSQWKQICLEGSQ